MRPMRPMRALRALRFLFQLAVLSLAVGAACACAQAAAEPHPAGTLEGTLAATRPRPSFVVRFFGAGTDTALAPGDEAVLDVLSRASPGDGLTLAVDDPAAPRRIERVVAVESRRGFVAACLYLLAAVAILVAFGLLATGNRPQLLVIGADNRYSMSKFQMAAWFFMLFTVYLASVLILLVKGWLGYLGQLEIPQNLVVLSGLSALTYGTAKLITVSKVEDAKANAAPEGIAAASPAQLAARRVVELKVQGARRPRLRDMVRDDEGCVDLGNCQALFITLLAIVLYVVSAFPFLMRFSVSAHMMLPDVDTTLLSLFGLGQGAYLIKKVAATAGKG